MLLWQLGKLYVTSIRLRLSVELLCLILPVAGDDEVDWDFGDMPVGMSTGREKPRMVLDNIQGLVKRASFPAPDSRLDALHLAECYLSDHLTLI